MINKRILIVDDENDIVELLDYNLRKDGYDTIIANDGLDAKNKLNKNIDLILLDVMMPNIDGLELCKIIKSDNRYSHIPIIFLTAKDSEIDEIIGLEAGASDYIYKPISIHKLKARIRVALRKNPLVSNQLDMLKIQGLVIDYENYRVLINDKSLNITRNEMEILFLLSQSPNKFFSRENILNQIWGDVIVSDRTIDTHIVNLRNKLGIYSKLLETKRGIGYSFTTDILDEN